VNSLGGVIIVKVFDRVSKELAECSIFTDVDETLEDYVSKFTNKTQSILNFLNAE
jgi:hypothetical protein